MKKTIKLVRNRLSILQIQSLQQEHRGLVAKIKIDNLFPFRLFQHDVIHQKWFEDSLILDPLSISPLIQLGAALIPLIGSPQIHLTIFRHQSRVSIATFNTNDSGFTFQNHFSVSAFNQSLKREYSSNCIRMESKFDLNKSSF